MRNTRFSTRWLAIFSAALLAGCATPPDLGTKPEIAAAQLASAQSFKGREAAWPTQLWWETYNDKTLNALIDEALADSPSLVIAAARVRQAQAALQQTGASQLPTLGAQASAEKSYKRVTADDAPGFIQNVLPSEWSNTASVSAKLDYQLDFFGRNRAAVAAAASRAQAAEAEAASARLQLSTAVAGTYAELARLTANRSSARDAVRVREDSFKLVSARTTRGLENQSQSRQSESELARARADLIAVEGSLARTRNALAALLGKGPDRGLTIEAPASAQLSPPGLPANLGLDLVGRRPDLAAARLRAEAAAKRIEMARADFYPNVNLTAVVGLQTLGLSQLGGGDLTFAQMGPAISLPIFSGGRIEGAYRSARAEYDEAVAQYDQTLSTALREVADAITDRRTLEGQLEQSRAALTASEAAYRLARLRYEGGLSNYITVLTIENGLIAQRQMVGDLEARAFAVDVAMIRALGGGYVSNV